MGMTVRVVPRRQNSKTLIAAELCAWNYLADLISNNPRSEQGLSRRDNLSSHCLAVDFKSFA